MSPTTSFVKPASRSAASGAWRAPSTVSVPMVWHSSRGHPACGPAAIGLCLYWCIRDAWRLVGLCQLAMVKFHERSSSLMASAIAIVVFASDRNARLIRTLTDFGAGAMLRANLSAQWQFQEMHRVFGRLAPALLGSRCADHAQRLPDAAVPWRSWQSVTKRVGLYKAMFSSWKW